MADNIGYNGSDKWKIRATELLNQSAEANVEDVKVIDADHPQGQSVVDEDKVAQIDLTDYAKGSDVVQSDWNESDSTDPAYIKNKPTIPDPQEQADWLEADTTDPAYIKNKPTLGTAAALDVPTSGDASSSQVVKGDDSRLSGWQTDLLGGNITSGDLNTYRTAGYYYVNTTNLTSVTNKPCAEAGMFEVIPKDTGTATAVLQRYTAVSGSSPRVVTGVYERLYISQAWQAWTHIGDNVFLPLTGGTLTGDLVINESSPSVALKDTSFTVDTSADNGVSSQQDNSYIVQDNAGLHYARFRGAAYTNGRVAGLIDARNMKTDGNRVTNYLAVGVNKDGTRYFSMPNDSDGDARAAFRSAIAIKDAPTPLTDSDNNITCAHGSHAKICSLTLTPGTWIVTYRATFGTASTTGTRRMYLATSESSTSVWDDSRITAAAAAAGMATDLSATKIISTSSSITRYLKVYQQNDERASIIVSGIMTAVKVINV